MENLLNSSRDKINEIDKEMSKLFLERMDVVRDVAKYKQENNMPVLNSAREREVIAKVTEGMTDDMAEYTKMLYINIFDITRSYQEQAILPETDIELMIQKSLESTKDFPKSATVACQGIEGANSTAACDRLFSRGSIMYMNTFDAVFKCVDSGLCQYGILPIENNLHGSVTEVYDLMTKYNFQIVRSAKVKIQHTLLCQKGKQFSDITEIYSHPQAIAQCSEFLKANPQIAVIECENTAISAQMIAASDNSNVAAIASHTCSELYGLDILSDNIQNSDNNYTRFICIAKNPEIYPGADKISLTFNVSHRPGTLYSVISKLSALGVNMTKLESRPIPGKDFEFMFYIDFEANIKETSIQRLITQISKSCENFAYLGSYREV